MVFVNISIPAQAVFAPTTVFHGLSGYYKCKIVGWCYVDNNTVSTSLIVGVNIAELRVPSSQFTFSFVKNNTTSHYPQELPIIVAQLNQYFTVNLQSLTGAGIAQITSLTAFSLYMECEEIAPNNLISN